MGWGWLLEGLLEVSGLQPVVGGDEQWEQVKAVCWWLRVGGDLSSEEGCSVFGEEMNNPKDGKKKTRIMCFIGTSRSGWGKQKIFSSEVEAFCLDMNEAEEVQVVSADD